MNTYYPNFPWTLDEKEYNCSSRTPAEWQARGSFNPKQGFYFLTTGSIYVTVYTISMIGMFRAKLLHIPCYRLMFFNGFLDMMDIIVGSLYASYQHFTGGVFCSNIALSVLFGHGAWGIWMSASIMCVALALNRVVEMIPSMNKYRFLFQGRNVYIWMAMSVAALIIRPFLTRPPFYNSSASAFVFAPVITDNLSWEIDYYTPMLYPLHNIVFPLVLVSLYLVLCIYVLKVKGFSNGKIDKTQLQLFLQSLVICTSTAIGSGIYVAIEFIAVPGSVVILANVMWQLSHGIHGLVYVVVNKAIRGEVLMLFGLKSKSGTATVSSVSSKPNLVKS